MNGFVRWWERTMLRGKLWWLTLAGWRLERRIEERKRQAFRSL
jgi:hypothetical protein